VSVVVGIASYPLLAARPSRARRVLAAIMLRSCFSKVASDHNGERSVTKSGGGNSPFRTFRSIDRSCTLYRSASCFLRR
jgi:hypothetical protein